jgi:hypothetical protein
MTLDWLSKLQVKLPYEVEYDAMTIRNYWSTNTRINDMALQYRVGTANFITLQLHMSK